MVVLDTFLDTCSFWIRLLVIMVPESEIAVPPAGQNVATVSEIQRVGAQNPKLQRRLLVRKLSDIQKVDAQSPKFAAPPAGQNVTNVFGMQGTGARNPKSHYHLLAKM